MRIPSRTAMIRISAIAFASAFILGCGGDDHDHVETAEEMAKKILPDSLTFTQKVERAIPHSLQQLQLFATNHPDEPRPIAVSLTNYVTREELEGLFDGIEIQYRSLYYGRGSFAGVYPVDPSLALDSTAALLSLEASTQLAERIRLGEAEVGNTTDEVQREAMEKELARMRGELEEIRTGGVLYYGAEVIAKPGPIMSLMERGGGLVRVLFPQQPAEGSWVRLSPYQYANFFERDRQTAPQ